MSPDPIFHFHSTAEAYAWLDGRVNYEKTLDGAVNGDFAASLSDFRRRLAGLGDPQRALSTIHLAGTRGKGSTALMLEALLEASGVRTATFTSPHLSEYRERIRLGGRPVPGNDFAASLARTAAPAGPQRGFKTVFETLTAMFFDLARRGETERAVVETGLGGRWDATNAIDPGPVLWTTIGFDHTHILGNTAGAIAGEKAAVLKPGGWAVMGAQDEPEAEEVFAARAAETGAEMLRAEELCPLESVEAGPDGLKMEIVFEGRRWVLELPIYGLFQARNLQNALAMLGELRRRGEIPIAPRKALEVALGGLNLPGRMTLLRRCGVDLIVDGAHCPSGARALAKSLQAHFGQRPAILCVAMMRDKDHERFFRELAGGWNGWREVWCYPAPGPRGMSPEDLSVLCRVHFSGVRVFQNMKQLLDKIGVLSDKKSMGRVANEGASSLVVAAGTFYTVASFTTWDEGERQDVSLAR